MTSTYQVTLTPASKDEADMRFDPLPPALIAHMQQQRAQVAALVASAFPTVPVQWPLLPSTLQRVVDAELIDHDDCDGWEALGVAFGDCLAQRVPELAWIQVTDAWGVDAVLRYGEANSIVSAVTLLIKRVEEGEAIEINHLLEALEEIIIQQALKSS
ncbi:hypothetical protein AB839_09230 [Stenotrophomonas sp. DDT-1]|uniref:DUF3806 domain-containing protein n=1 Tax=Stenotrophomonas TaxID=40323 RepID=UPI000777A18F|nr:MULTISPECIES: DUF3806 domain-containing protein [Stenotrophomonas]KXU97112.1 hypothetical protein AB839_09230 [Stenotrophomonas sp. DDT-1]